MKRKIFILLINLLVSLTVFAQSDKSYLKLENGVRAHKEIDEIYRRFSESYRTLNVEMVSNLYAEDAAYLAPEDDISFGRAAIRESFRGFFDSVKAGGQNISISFQIFQRTVEKNMAYDVGIYTIHTFKDGKQIGAGRGKFVVVALKDKTGKWLFQVDGYSGLKPPAGN